MKKLMPINQRLNRIMILIVSFSFIVTSVITSFIQISEKNSSFQQIMTGQVRLANSVVDYYISQYSDSLNNIIKLLKKNSNLLLIEQYLDIKNLDISFYVIDEKGNVVHTNKRFLESFKGLDFGHMLHVKSKSQVSKVFQSILTHTPVISIKQSINDKLKIYFEVDLQKIIPAMLHFEVGKIFKRQQMFILSDSGVVVYHPDRSLIRSRFNLGFELKHLKKWWNSKLVTYEYNNLNFIAYNEITSSDINWRIFYSLPHDIIRITILNSLVESIVIVFFIFLFVYLSLIVAVNKYFSRSVREIVNELGHYDPNKNEGKLLIENHSGILEFSTIIESINSFAEQVITFNKKLRLKDERTELLLNSMEESVYVLDHNGICNFCNNSFVLMLGYDRNEILGHKINHIIHQSSQYSNIDDDQILKSCFVKQNVHDQNQSLIKKNGEMLPVEFWAHPLILENKVKGAIVTFVDITDRKRDQEKLVDLNKSLESRVEKRTLQLQESNQELESFAYAVSHDLRAPLRGISGFSQILFEEYGDKFDDEGNDYIKRIRLGCLKMSSLVDELLKLSRLTRQNINIETFNLIDIVKDLKSDFHSPDENKIIQFIFPEKLFIEADIGLMKVVMTNLVNNSWKFSKNTKQSFIEIGVVEKNGEKIIFVKDNGIGFNNKLIDRLFQPFSKMHGDRFEGQGIGLATVKRVINRHGGKIWADGEKDIGATFYFKI